MSAPDATAFPVPVWFSRLSGWGIALLRPFLPAALLAKLEHAAWFIAVGSFNTLASYLLFVLFLNVFHASHEWALFGAYGLGMLIAYQTFSRFVFSSDAKNSFLRFVPGYVVLFLANAGLLELFLSVSGWPEELCQFLLLPVVAALSYVINRFLVFRL